MWRLVILNSSTRLCRRGICPESSKILLYGVINKRVTVPASISIIVMLGHSFILWTFRFFIYVGVESTWPSISFSVALTHQFCLRQTKKLHNGQREHRICKLWCLPPFWIRSSSRVLWSASWEIALADCSASEHISTGYKYPPARLTTASTFNVFYLPCLICSRLLIQLEQ